MGILFEQVDLVTGNGDEVLRDGYLLVEGDRITAMGQGSFSMDETADISHSGAMPLNHHHPAGRMLQPDPPRTHQRIAAPGCVLMPAFYNAHTHVAMTLLRNHADDMDLQTWLFTRIFPAEARFDDAAVGAGTRLGLLEMLAGGTAGFIDMYDHCDATAEAVEDAGMRLLMTRGLLNTDDAGNFGNDSRLLEAKALHARWDGAGNGRIRTGFGPHSVYTCSPAYLRVVADEAMNLGVPVHVHVDETRREHEECLARHGLTPAALCEQAGLFGGHAVAAHCVHVTDEDLALLAAHDVTIAHNPRSNLKLASGVAPVLRARVAGIPVALGTDGASSNNTLDMWAEMSLTSLLHKGTSLDPLAVSASEALVMATRAGAQAMGMRDAGFLQIGAKADLVMADGTGAHWMPVHNRLSAVAYSGRSSDVRLTMVDGRILYRDGAYMTLDAERIRHEVASAMERIFGL